MFKKIVFSLSLLMTLGFGANFDDGWSAYEKEDFKTAFVIWEDLASKRDAKAQLGLGVMYRDGQGVKQDFKKQQRNYDRKGALDT